VELPQTPSLRGVDRLHGTPGSFEVFVCRDCGSGRTLPYVPPESLGALYPADYNAYALPANVLLRLLATGLFELRYRNALRSEPLRRLASARPGRLLDVGSGRGDLGLVLQRRGWRVVGLEPSERACSEARQRGVPTEMGTLTEAPMLEPPFDAIVFNHSLEHVVEPLADLGRARELTSDDGLLLVLVPNFGSWQRRRFGTYWFHLDLPRHRSHFTGAGLTRLFERAGLTTVAVGSATSADGLPMSLQYKAFGRRRLDHGAGRYGALAATLALLPATMLANRAAGSGDILYGIARAAGT
jgi:SAM-dependent methyltransferase